MKTVDDIEQPAHGANGGGPRGPAAAGRSGSPPAAHHPGLLGRLWRKAWNGGVARGTAAVWMTMLIALPVVVAFLTVWGGPARATRPDDLS
ncbi:MAG TPA: hypothetical protein VGR06_30860, partial [Actinophytocola sp.]|uniref:hypothetical protein n=1 Tax=Actinophytocola sp. TaxID=1872138 RepID=UPI002DFA7217|nr:hypothetical protein [Actinophytocola sp.]